MSASVHECGWIHLDVKPGYSEKRPVAGHVSDLPTIGQVTRSASVGTFAGDSLLGKSVNQKLTDQFESLVGS